MSQQSIRHDGSQEQEPVPEQPMPAGGAGKAPAASVRDQQLDALLDDIDDVLAVNAEEFVRGFVQKGGQ